MAARCWRIDLRPGRSQRPHISNANLRLLSRLLVQDDPGTQLPMGCAYASLSAGEQLERLESDTDRPEDAERTMTVGHC